MRLLIFADGRLQLFPVIVIPSAPLGIHVSDLKAYCRELYDAREVIKMLSQKPDALLLTNILYHIACLDTAHLSFMPSNSR